MKLRVTRPFHNRYIPELYYMAGDIISVDDKDRVKYLLENEIAAEYEGVEIGVSVDGESEIGASSAGRKSNDEDELTEMEKDVTPEEVGKFLDELPKSIDYEEIEDKEISNKGPVGKMGPPGIPYEKWTVPKLKEVLIKIGIEFDENAKKPELIKLLEEAE